MPEPIGENVNLKLRLKIEELTKELEKVKIQRDIEKRKLIKSLEINKQLRKVIET